MNMSTVEIETGRYVKRFAFWNPATWSIPKLYWDAWSQEQRLHAICRQLEKVIAYADYIGVNVDDIATRLKAIEEGQLDPIIEAAIEAWFEENEPEIASAIEQLQENMATVINEIGTGFDSENTIAKAIEDEIEARTNADNAINGILDSLSNKTKQLDFNCRFRRIAASNTNTSYNNSVQGMTMFGGSNTRILAQALIVNDDAKIMLYGYDNDTEIANITGAYGHLNDLAYKDGKLYALEDANNVIHIFTVSANAISYDSAMTPPETCAGISYSESKDKWYLVSSLGQSVGIKIYEYTSDFGTLTNEIVFPFAGNAIIQGLHVTDDAYYIALTEPNTIIYINANTQDFYYINVPDMIGHCYTDEVEGIFVDDDLNMFINTNSNVDLQLLCSVFETNLMHNVEKEVSASVQQSRLGTITAIIDAVNGDLVSPGEYGHTFKLVGDAINYANALGDYELTLDFVEDYPYPIMANGANFSMTVSDVDKVIELNGLLLRYCNVIAYPGRFILKPTNISLMVADGVTYGGSVVQSTFAIPLGTWHDLESPDEYDATHKRIYFNNCWVHIQDTSYYRFNNCLVVGASTESDKSIYARTGLVGHSS